METELFVVTALVTVLWSVWNYRLWTERAGLSEESPFRLLMIAGPSAYFLLIVLSGWQESAFVRLDLLGLAALDALTVCLSAVLGVYVLARKPGARAFFIFLYVVYNGAALLLVAAILLLRSHPVLLIRLASFFRAVEEIEVLSFAWLALDRERQQQDVSALLNKLLVAAVSYLPVAAIRLLATTRQQAKIRREIEVLKRRIGELEHRSEI